MSQIKVPKVSIDMKSRTVLFEQQHPILLDEQKVLVPIAMVKQIMARIMEMEAQAEVQHSQGGIPRPPSPNGEGGPS